MNIQTNKQRLLLCKYRYIYNKNSNDIFSNIPVCILINHKNNFLKLKMNVLIEGIFIIYVYIYCIWWPVDMYVYIYCIWWPVDMYGRLHRSMYPTPLHSHPTRIKGISIKGIYSWRDFIWGIVQLFQLSMIIQINDLIDFINKFLILKGIKRVRLLYLK